MEDYKRIYQLKKIETPRLILRPPQQDDALPLNQAIHHSLKMLQEWMAWASDPSLETTTNHIQMGITNWQSQNSSYLPMVIIDRVTEKIIGATGYNDRSDFKQGIYEIGYWLDVRSHSKGLATECAHALTQFALAELHANQVILRIQIDNQKSIAIAERLGFQKIGIVERSQEDALVGKINQDFKYVCNDFKKLSHLNMSYHFCEITDLEV